MSLLAEQTYGWQIWLIRKLLAFASFPAPVSVIYDLPILYLVILMTQEFCTSKCVLWPAFRVMSKCAAYQFLDSIDDSKIAKQVCLMPIL